MYKILIIGHGGFPKGVYEATNLIVGQHDNVSWMNIDEEKGHEELERQIKDFLKHNEHVIIFADFSGGAPHQIAAHSIMEQKTKTHFVVSGAPISFLIQIILIPPKLDEDPIEIKTKLKTTLKDTFKVARVMSV